MTDQDGYIAYLREIGVPETDISSATDLDELELVLWYHVFGVAGERATISDAARMAQADEETIKTLTNVLGFGNVDRFGLTTDDVDVLRLFTDSTRIFGREQTLQLARVIRASVGRIAYAVSSSARTDFEARIMQERSHLEFVRLAKPLLDELLPMLAKAMDRIVRHDLLAISAQSYGMDPELRATTAELAVGFADMVGFTSHSSTLSTADLAGVIDRFEGRVSDTISAAGGRVVKFIGDEVMFTHPEASAACRCALDLLALSSEAEIPDVRVGLAHGLVLTRYGDCYGPVVNIASRLVQIAGPGTVLVTPDIADHADGFGFTAEAPAEVKGIEEPVSFLRLLASP